jgi:serine/threonine protein kinase/tetratricopeptide (TPR) repeat protein
MHDALRSLFREVVDLSPPERLRYFDERGVATELRAEVESLVSFDTKSPEPLADFVLAGTGLEPELTERCGPYTLVRLLGRGGMGTVFLARRTDGELEQSVAIKLVSSATMTTTFRTRFLQERQILASLQHPGIARLLDAGHTTGGHPYLVMEFVDGVPIDVYAGRLGIRDRLALFLRVCDSIWYAHRNLVIHRDIKPSNILVDATGQPKLLDFGIARMLDDAADPAVTKERLLTPEYASPEQVRGAAHTTATDVYSLGAVLYRLLAGKSPHAIEGRSDEAIESLICSTDPVAPSRLNREAPRDLDFVVLKALRKEPDERYRSVDAFADDVRAFLASRPVQARSGSVWYWTRTFIRRRWLPVSATAAVVASLTVGLYVANRERRIAERRFQDLRQLANQLLTFDASLRDLPGSTTARRQIVAASMAYLDGLGRDARPDRDLAMEVANGYIALAQVQGVPTWPNLGQSDAAARSLGKADGLLQAVLSKEPGRPETLLKAARVEQYLMIIADTQKHDEEALAHAQRCGEYLGRLMRSGRASSADVREAIGYFENVGLAYMNLNRLDEATRYDRRAVDLARETGDAGALAQGLSLLANTLRLSGDLDAALPSIVEARRLVENTPYPSDVRRVSGQYAILIRQGQILGADEGISLNRPDEAIEPFEKAFDLVEREAAQDPNDATIRDRVATAARQLADIVRHRDPERALAIYDRAIQRQREVQNNASARRQEARLLANSSYPLRSLGRIQEAQKRIDQSLDLLHLVDDYPRPAIPATGEAAAALRALADQQAGTGDTTGALDTYRGLLANVLASRPERELREAYELSRIYAALGRLLGTAGISAEAGELDRRRLNLWREWNTLSPNNPVVLRQLRAASETVHPQ